MFAPQRAKAPQHLVHRLIGRPGSATEARCSSAGLSAPRWGRDAESRPHASISWNGGGGLMPMYSLMARPAASASAPWRELAVAVED